MPGATAPIRAVPGSSRSGDLYGLCTAAERRPGGEPRSASCRVGLTTTLALPSAILWDGSSCADVGNFDTGICASDGVDWRCVSEQNESAELPVFVTEDNRARLMTIYDDALRRWPVPFETFFVETRYGKTHVIASGDPAAPPVVMTHPMGVGGFVWSSIIGARERAPARLCARHDRRRREERVG